MDQTDYHVLLEGRSIGPYDRRTIIGMRIKKTLTSDDVLISTGGARLTVAELIGQRPPQPFSPERSGSFSAVQATYSASLLKVHGPGMAIPAFKGEVQARVQGEVLRIAGRFRRGLGWKEDRVKLVLKDVVHARVLGSQVDLWLSNVKHSGLQRISLELFTPESAGELVDWLPAATPLPEPGGRVVAPLSMPRMSTGMWVAVAGVAVVLGLVLMVLLRRRVY